MRLGWTVANRLTYSYRGGETQPVFTQMKEGTSCVMPLFSLLISTRRVQFCHLKVEVEVVILM
jgi:hypothetical protein